LRNEICKIFQQLLRLRLDPIVAYVPSMTMAVRDLESSIFTTWDRDGEEERGGEEEGGRDRVEEGERERGGRGRDKTKKMSRGRDEREG
jgi:hypothetical protein